MSVYKKNLEFFKNNLESVYDCLMFEKSKYDSKINIIDDSLNLMVENDEKNVLYIVLIMLIAKLRICLMEWVIIQII